MLLPDVALSKERVILLVNSVILALAWMRYSFLPKTRPSFGVLGAFTLIYAALLLLQIMVNGRHRGLKFSLDLNVVFGSYCLILVLLPLAYANTAIVDHLTGAGISVSLIGVPLSYVPRNRLYGIRIPATKSSPAVWQKTNHLAARICFGFGGLSFLLGLLGQAAFVLTMAVGAVVLVVGTSIYARKLS